MIDAESHLDLVERVERLEESVNRFLFGERQAFEDYVEELARVLVENRVTIRQLGIVLRIQQAGMEPVQALSAEAELRAGFAHLLGQLSAGADALDAYREWRNGFKLGCSWSGAGLVFPQTMILEAQGHFPILSTCLYTRLFGGLGLKENWFLSLDDAAEEVKSWRRDYNGERPHRVLGNLSPWASPYWRKQEIDSQN